MLDGFDRVRDLGDGGVREVFLNLAVSELCRPSPFDHDSGHLGYVARNAGARRFLRDLKRAAEQSREAVGGGVLPC